MSGPTILLREGILENPETTSEQITSLHSTIGSGPIRAVLLLVQAASPLDVGGLVRSTQFQTSHRTSGTRTQITAHVKDLSTPTKTRLCYQRPPPESGPG